MRILNGILFLLMLAFVAVQYNDPDGPWWMLIYGIPAAWACVAAFRPGLLARRGVRLLWLAALALAAFGTFYYWPPVAEWWRESVWWNVEEAREGMGMMIVIVVLLVAGGPYLRNRQSSTATTSASRSA